MTTMGVPKIVGVLSKEDNNNSGDNPLSSSYYIVAAWVRNNNNNNGNDNGDSDDQITSFSEMALMEVSLMNRKVVLSNPENLNQMYHKMSVSGSHGSEDLKLSSLRMGMNGDTNDNDNGSIIATTNTG
eukprot:635631_1